MQQQPKVLNWDIAALPCQLLLPGELEGAGCLVEGDGVSLDVDDQGALVVKGLVQLNSEVEREGIRIVTCPGGWVGAGRYKTGIRSIQHTRHYEVD